MGHLRTGQRAERYIEGGVFMGVSDLRLVVGEIFGAELCVWKVTRRCSQMLLWLLILKKMIKIEAYIPTIVTEAEVLVIPAIFETRTSYRPLVFLVIFLITMVVLVSVVTISAVVIFLPFLNHSTLGCGTPVNSTSRTTSDSFSTVWASSGFTISGAW